MTFSGILAITSLLVVFLVVFFFFTRTDMVDAVDDKVIINDPNLKAELVVENLDYPTAMAVLSPDDILVLEKDKGTLQRILNGAMLERPILNVGVDPVGEDGRLGIAVGNKDIENSHRYVFLYFTNNRTDDMGVTNQLYRYQLADNDLIDPKLLLELPPSSHSIHNGGKLVIGPDNNLYATVGDLGSKVGTKILNNVTGAEANGIGGIVRLTQSGEPVVDPKTGEYILGESYPLNLYYAYGIRNSFGIDFDPVTGNLWDTENGPGYGDEINLVLPGFNSGWNKLIGMWKNGDDADPRDNDGAPVSEQDADLVDFGGRGDYLHPKFAWMNTVGPTAVTFLNTDRYGEEYKDDMLVSDFNYGNIYHFDLSKNRTELLLAGPLRDRIANEDDNLEDVLFAQAPGGIVDMQIGPDGYLYILSVSVKVSDCDPKAPGCLVNDRIMGSIFKIVPNKD